MKVALAQIDTVGGDVWGNVEKVADALDRAVEGGAELVAFPELTVTGYPPEDPLLPDGEGAPPILKSRHTLVGLSICEDIWYPGGPPREQAIGGASVLLNVSASPYHRLKGNFRERMLAVRASDYGCYVIFCNLVGGQDQLVFDGHSVVFDPGGNLIARAKQFEEDLLFADLYPEEALIHHLQEPLLRKERAARAPEVIEVLPPEPGRPIDMADVPSVEYRIEPALSEEGEVLEALVLGLRD